MFLLITFSVSTVAELISLKTPIGIFGAKYKYDTNHRFFSSRILFLGVYPLEISLAWVILKYLSFCLAIPIAEAFGLPYYAVIFGTPLILVSLDLILDPVAVNIKKYWTWEKGSAYFGIPLRNFLGWYAVGLVGTFCSVFLVTRRKTCLIFYIFCPSCFTDRLSVMHHRSTR
ncbi:MAG: carotenoid biosynthesis protein [Patescibacteria group bacterium]